jgi:hypothetical protein
LKIVKLEAVVVKKTASSLLQPYFSSLPQVIPNKETINITPPTAANHHWPMNPATITMNIIRKKRNSIVEILKLKDFISFIFNRVNNA